MSPCLFPRMRAIHPAHTQPTPIIRRVIASYGRELAPVCAVVGGLLVQEITKGLSQRDEPLRNFFFYDASPDAREPGAGLVRCIPE